MRIYFSFKVSLIMLTLLSFLLLLLLLVLDLAAVVGAEVVAVDSCFKLLLFLFFDAVAVRVLLV